MCSELDPGVEMFREEGNKGLPDLQDLASLSDAICHMAQIRSLHEQFPMQASQLSRRLLAFNASFGQKLPTAWLDSLETYCRSERIAPKHTAKTPETQDAAANWDQVSVSPIRRDVVSFVQIPMRSVCIYIFRF